MRRTAIEVCVVGVLLLVIWWQADTKSAAQTYAKQCSVERKALAVQSKRFAIESEAANKVASKKAQTHYQKADAILQTPQQGDVCESAQNRVDTWLKPR